MAHAGLNSTAGRWNSARSGPDRELARIAAEQHGVVTFAQLMAVGFSPGAVQRRAETGQLHRIHHGVFAVGHPPITPQAHWLAAVLACGEGAVLSHRSAAALWRIRESAATRIDVTCPTRGGRSRTGIAIHRADALTSADVTRVDRIPCTTIVRTVLDLAGVLSADALEYAIHRAQSRRLLDRNAVSEALERSPRRRGSAAVRRILELGLDEDEVRSRLERGFRRICRCARLPPPRVNMWIPLGAHGVEVDFAWPEQRLAVETDSRALHDTNRAFENDPQRDRLLMLNGWRVARFTYRDVTERPDLVAAQLRRFLAA